MIECRIQPPFGDDICDDTKIIRYLSFTKFVAMLEESSLHFHRIDKLQDQFECSWTYPSKDMYNAELVNTIGDTDASNKIIQNHDYLLNIARMYTYVNSWCIGWSESVAMWKLFVQPPTEGIAIASTIGRLKSSFKERMLIDRFRKIMTKEITVFMGKVEYIDYENDAMDVSNLINLSFYKRKCYSYENEFRAIFLNSLGLGAVLKDIKNNELQSGIDIDHVIGHDLPIDTCKIIEKIYLSPESERWYVDLVKSVHDQYMLDIPIIESSIDMKPLL